MLGVQANITWATQRGNHGAQRKRTSCSYCFKSLFWPSGELREIKHKELRQPNDTAVAFTHNGSLNPSLWRATMLLLWQFTLPRPREQIQWQFQILSTGTTSSNRITTPAEGLQIQLKLAPLQVKGLIRACALSAPRICETPIQLERSLRFVRR